MTLQMLQSLEAPTQKIVIWEKSVMWQFGQFLVRENICRQKNILNLKLMSSHTFSITKNFLLYSISKKKKNF